MRPSPRRLTMPAAASCVNLDLPTFSPLSQGPSHGHEDIPPRPTQRPQPAQDRWPDQWPVGGGSSRFDVNDPATGLKLADVANLGPKDAEAAIAAANAAWPAWKTKTAKERSIILRKWFDLLMANQDDLGRIMTAEQGKPLAEAKGEVAYGASFVEWFAEEAKRINGETLPQFDNSRRLLVLKQPIGVCAAITPWNFPLAMITRK